MLDAGLQTQLREYFQKILHPVELIASLDGSDGSNELRTLLQLLVSLSPKLSYSERPDAERTPSFVISRVGTPVQVRFAALPMGHEFSSLVLAILQVGGHPTKVDEALQARIATLGAHGEPLVFETYLSLSCQNCPEVVQALNAMAVLNPRIQHTAIDGGWYEAEVTARNIMAVPAVYLNGSLFAQGRMGVQEIVDKLDAAGQAAQQQRAAAQLDAEAPFDVLIVGGGPAGATAALYAARKGLRTGIVAERFGGQVQDTLAIENYPSVAHTEGPRFSADLQQQVQAVGVSLMLGQQVAALTPEAGAADGLQRLKLGNGAELKARSLILAPGARWRNLNVPGEDEYRNRGVAYCPHCDGPLFKGKRVAVIGGGNSGVEAAIDLAGITAHVTLLEFASELRADAVLVEKLRSLPNVTIHTDAQTKDVQGDGQRVTGLNYIDRRDQSLHAIALEGVFVQIGLVPNTEWLQDAVERTRYGEIVIDARGATSRAGVFAAGDATTVPFKQIVMAAGEGAKASLSAFDYLIRHAQPVAA